MDKELSEEFNKFALAVREILVRHSPSPRHDYIPQATGIAERRMTTLSEIIEKVNNTLASILGNDGPDLLAEVHPRMQNGGAKFVAGTNNNLMPDIIQCLKLRLMGAAAQR